jgi:hypothetical protein
VLLHPYILILTCNLVMQVGTRNNVSDLEMQPFYRFIRDTYIIHPIAMGLLLYALGGPPFVIWGMVRKQNAFTGLLIMLLCQQEVIFLRISGLKFLNFAGCSDSLGLSYNLACKLSCSCLGLSGMEYWGSF